MSDRNKSIALEFVRRLAQKEAVNAFELLSDDATWWYQPSIEGGGGTGLPKAVMQGNLVTMLQKLDGPFRLDVVGITAENERVAVELAGDARTRKGIPYRNTYHLLFIIRNGQIAAIREYCDTALSLQMIPEFLGE